MQFEFQVSVEVERSEGKFESRDDIEAEIVESLEAADPGTIEGPQYQGTYDVQLWDVQPLESSKAKRKPKVDNSIRDYLRAMRRTVADLEASPSHVQGQVIPREAVGRLSRQLDGLFVRLADAKVISIDEAKEVINGPSK